MYEDEWQSDTSSADLDGFQLIRGEAGGDHGQPVQPTLRCRRCGCWLNSHNISGLYCAACETYIHQHSKLCSKCGEPFFSKQAEVVRCPSCEGESLANKQVCDCCGASYLPYVCSNCRGKPAPENICHACHWRETHAEKAALHERECRVCGCRFLPRTCRVPECREKLTDICTVCHEEEKHMGMTAKVWTLFDCPRCHKAIAALDRRRRKVTCHSLENLVSGEEPDLDAMTQLSICGGIAPLVFLDGRFLSPEEINALISEEEA